MRSRVPTNYQLNVRVERKRITAMDATEFLHSHDTMAALLPTVKRLIALQKDCSSVLPTIFNTCSVLRFDATQLLIAAPNSALATKLKQQLPKLQESLLRMGWEVNVIRIKVQVSRPTPQIDVSREKLDLPPTALDAFAKLNGGLNQAPCNAELKAALALLLKKRGRFA